MRLTLFNCTYLKIETRFRIYEKLTLNTTIPFHNNEAVIFYPG